MGLSKKVRFEVFKRDSFTCQYCGKKAPDVVLQVDHIEPISKGGSDEFLNLTTSCQPCNAGKSDRRLDDSSVVMKQRSQLEDLQDRQEQLRMLIDWQRSLVDTESHLVDEAASFWCDIAGWHAITEDGKADLRKFLRQHSTEEVFDAMRKATGYFRYDEDGNPTSESSEHGFSKIGGIIRVSLAEKERPWMKDMYYTRGIVRKRLEGGWYSNHEARQLLEKAYEAGVPTTESRDVAFAARGWRSWKDDMLELIELWSDRDA
jgi:hypothetical protein